MTSTELAVALDAAGKSRGCSKAGHADLALQAPALLLGAREPLIKASGRMRCEAGKRVSRDSLTDSRHQRRPRLRFMRPSREA